MHNNILCMVAVGLAEDVDAAGVDGIFFYIIRKLRHSVVKNAKHSLELAAGPILFYSNFE